MMDPATPSSNSGSDLKIWSCVTCRRRKVRCDRRDPCANCTRANIECHYPVTGRVPRRSKDPSAWRSPTQKQGELLSRLRRLEAVVTELTAQVEDGSSQHGAQVSHAMPLPFISGTTPEDGTDQPEHIPLDQALAGTVSNSLSIDASTGGEFDEEFGSLVVQRDGGLQIGKQFWSVFCSEVDHILQAVHDVASYDEAAKSSMSQMFLQSVPHNQSFVFPNTTSPGALDTLNPLPSQMPFIWQIFVERVDPFVNVLDLSSIDKAIRGLKGSFSTAGPAMEALLFAVSLSAVVSMDAADALNSFGMEKAVLLAKYRLGTEQALGQASFLTTKDITVLQAFVIYVSILPYLGEDDLTWSLTGALVRVAESFGLDGDHSAQNDNILGLHERLKWHICFINSRTQGHSKRHTSIRKMQDVGSEFGFASANQNPLPLSQPVDEPGAIIFLLRCGIWRIARTFKKTHTEEHHLQRHLMQAAKTSFRKTYDSVLHINSPITGFGQEMVDLFFANAELGIQTSSNEQGTSGQNAPGASSISPETLQASIDIINSVYALKTEPAWSKWGWQLEGSLPWAALGILLQEAGAKPMKEELFQSCIRSHQILFSASEVTRKHRLWQPFASLAQDLTDAINLSQSNCNLPNHHHVGGGATRDSILEQVTAPDINQDSTFGATDEADLPRTAATLASEPWMRKAGFVDGDLWNQATEFLTAWGF